MLNAARNHQQNPNNLKFIQADFGQDNWQKQPLNNQKFDVIVSGFAIHHQPDNRKKQLYEEIYQYLNSGGIFLNLEHVVSRSPLGEKCFDEIFVDSLYHFHQQQKTIQSRTEIREKYFDRADKIANILAPVENQYQWLREIGYAHVDCYLKIFELSLFGGCKV